MTFLQCDHSHIFADRCHVILLSNGEIGSMVVVDALLIVAMMFFLFLPITDRKTVRMKLFVVCAIATVLAVSVTWTPAPDLQLASAARYR